MTADAVDLVLSGGGAKTAAHLGAVRALTEARLDVSRYVATSMGAVIPYDVVRPKSIFPSVIVPPVNVTMPTVFILSLTTAAGVIEQPVVVVPPVPGLPATPLPATPVLPPRPAGPLPATPVEHRDGIGAGGEPRGDDRAHRRRDVA